MCGEGRPRHPTRRTAGCSGGGADRVEDDLPYTMSDIFIFGSVQHNYIHVLSNLSPLT